MPKIRQKNIFGGIRKTLTAIIAILFIAGFFVLENINPTSAVTPVALDATNFPDELFRRYLGSTYDEDGDGMLSPKEIARVNQISIQPTGQVDLDKIKDLTGIHHFTELQSINLADHAITKLDLSRNQGINSIIVPGNQISSLKLPDGADIYELDASRNNLTRFPTYRNLKIRSLNLSDNHMRTISLGSLTTLEVLNLSGCNLGSVNLSKNTSLKELDLSLNEFSKLNLTTLTQLRRLIIDNSINLKALDLSANVNLVEFTSTGNIIEDFDFSHNINLEALKLSGALTSLDLSANTKLDPARCSFGPFNYSVNGREISTLKMPGNFDKSKITHIQGAHIDGDIIMVDPNIDKATYKYSVGNPSIPDVEFNLLFEQQNVLVAIKDMTNTAPYQQGEKATFKVSVKNNRLIGLNDLQLVVSFTDQNGAIDDSGFTIRDSTEYTVESGNVVVFNHVVYDAVQDVYIDFENNKNLTGSRTISVIARRQFGTGMGDGTEETVPVTLSFSLEEYVEPPVPTGIDDNFKPFIGIVAIGLFGFFFIARPIRMLWRH